MQNSMRLILIVSDVAEDRDRLRHFLTHGEADQYRLLEAASAAEALVLCRRDLPDCLLLDDHLPDARVDELLRAIATEFGVNGIGVVVLMRHDDVDSGMTVLRAGAHDFVVKSRLHAIDLHRAVGNAIEKVNLLQRHQQADADHSQSALTSNASDEITRKLRESEARLKLALQASFGTFSLHVPTNTVQRFLSRDAVLTQTNAACPDTFEHVVEVIHPDDRQRFVTSVQHALVHPDQIYTCEYRVPQPDGSVRWLSDVGGVAECDENGEPLWLMGMAMDITARKQTEAALRESEERYRTLFSSIDEGFCILEMIFDANNRPVDYRFLETNPMFERQTGLKDAVGRTARELVPNLEPHWFEIYGRVALTGEPTRFVNGSEAMERWFDVYACKIGNAESRKVGLLFNDITERRRSEQALRQSEERLRLGMQIADFALAEVNYDTSTIALSADAALLYGLGSDAITVLRERVRATFHPEDQEKLAGIIQNVLRPEGSGWFELEHRVVWPDGKVRWLNVHEQVFFDSTVDPPRPVRAILAAQDITERKQSELDARFLADIGTLLGRISDASELIAAITEAVGRYFGVTRCALHQTDLAQGVVLVEHDFHGGLPSLAGTHDVSGYSPEDVADFAAGRTVVRNDTKTDPRTAHLYAANYAPGGFRAIVVVPVLRLGQLVAALWVSSHEPRIWTPTEVSLLRTVAERTWLAVENARLQAATVELNNKLESRVAKRTRALRESQAQLRKLSAYVERAREEQSTRIAREVHDELGSALTGLKMTLTRVAKGREGDADLAARILDMRDQIDGLVQSVRRIASDLRPPLLDDLGLVAALEWQASEWAKRTGIACLCDMPQTEVNLDRETRTAVFRAFQESLTNVARHAQATQVTATLRIEDEQVVLVIRDNGRGISASALRPGKSLGLMGLRERIREVSGEVEIIGIPDKGTTVTIRVAAGSAPLR